jgi:disulfide bond formation protein DsbB
MTAGTETSPATVVSDGRGRYAGVCVWAALVVAVAAVAGSLFLSLGLGLKACPLCFYQRAFAMGVAAVLAVGLLSGTAGPRGLGLLALPIAVAGLGVAGFHVLLEASGKLECPRGVLGLGSAPQQSLAAFLVLFALLLPAALPGPAAGAGGWAVLAGTLVLGVLLALGSSVSNPPMPDPPAKPYDKAPDVCRPPFRPSS